MGGIVRCGAWRGGGEIEGESVKLGWGVVGRGGAGWDAGEGVGEAESECESADEVR